MQKSANMKRQKLKKRTNKRLGSKKLTRRTKVVMGWTKSKRLNVKLR